MKNSIAFDFNNLSPDLDTITGSTIIGTLLKDLRDFTTIAIISLSYNMPSLIAEILKSFFTDKICASTKEGGIFVILLTSCVFCAVTQVTAVAAKTFIVLSVLMSA